MADITKCSGQKPGFICPYRWKCYRFLAPDNIHWQAYYTEIPFNVEVKNCSDFMEN